MEKQSNFKDLPKDFQDKMLKWEEQSPANLQLKALEEIAKKTQTVINELSNTRLKDDKNSGNMGSLLIDIRESLDAVFSKEDPEYPEMPDYSKPVVEAVVKLEKALSSSIKSIDVKPKIDVASPVVKVDVPKIDIKGIEKILKTDIPKAFEKAIKLMPKEMPEDYTPLIAKFDEMAEILQSIDTASRLKPTAPKTVSVTNPDGSNVGASKATEAYAINNKEATATYKYFGFQKSDGGWYIMRKTIATNIFEYVAGASAYATAWTNRATQTYTDYATAF